jgi:hypothetical protein
MVLLPTGFTLPSMSPSTRWALTPPFQPYLFSPEEKIGGIFSVALSVPLRAVAVSNCRFLKQLGLSSTAMTAVATVSVTRYASYRLRDDNQVMSHENNCIHCGFPADSKELKMWRWQGWNVKGAVPAPARVGKRDDYDMPFHKECFPEFLHNRDEGLQDLDRPLNACKYFVRTGTSMLGYYVRDEKKHMAVAYWTTYDICGTALFPTVIREMTLDFPYVKISIEQPHALLASFQAFLERNGWLEGEAWYEPRKSVVYKDAVLCRMKERFSSGK